MVVVGVFFGLSFAWGFSALHYNNLFERSQKYIRYVLLGQELRHVEEAVVVQHARHVFRRNNDPIGQSHQPFSEQLPVALFQRQTDYVLILGVLLIHVLLREPDVKGWQHTRSSRFNNVKQCDTRWESRVFHSLYFQHRFEYAIADIRVIVVTEPVSRNLTVGVKFKVQQTVLEAMVHAVAPPRNCHLHQWGDVKPILPGHPGPVLYQDVEYIYILHIVHRGVMKEVFRVGVCPPLQ